MRAKGQHKRNLALSSIVALLTCALGLGVVLQSGTAHAAPFGKKSQEEKLEKEAEGTKASDSAEPGVYEGPKKIIAATLFKSTAGISYDAGEALSAMLTEALMKTGKFLVVERTEVQEILGEQDLGAEGRTNAATAAKIGNMLGASILVMGTVTQFEQNAASGGGGISVPIGGSRIGVGGGKTTGVVELKLRLVDTTTGQVLEMVTANGTFTGKSKSGSASIEGVQLSGGNSKQEPIGQAAEEAINKAVEYIARHMEKVPFQAKVAEVEGADIYINAGSNRNMKAGMTLDGFKIVKEIKDPDTGLVIGVNEEKTGTVEVTNVQDKLSICKIVSGKVGKGQTLRLSN